MTAFQMTFDWATPQLAAAGTWNNPAVIKALILPGRQDHFLSITSFTCNDLNLGSTGSVIFFPALSYGRYEQWLCAAPSLAAALPNVHGFTQRSMATKNGTASATTVSPGAFSSITAETTLPLGTGLVVCETAWCTAAVQNPIYRRYLRFAVRAEYISSSGSPAYVVRPGLPYFQLPQSGF
jgi:hypothetical protein